MARLMVLPGMLARPEMELATALAAMAEVPSVEVRLLTQSLPIWNMPFSSPEGMPMPRMRRIICRSGFISARLAMCSGFSTCCCCQNTQMAAKMRPASVARAAPSTPIRNP